ncbi:MAG: hypothetical protein A3J51_00395 [Omnitrophica WOR_2 bacterium RIFCSPHIGHO2_02_FULL_45_21]|nr:MAG: hypothetical protein A3J51_00395 [Omnitrophica WOR_2 bacterium RIFCSPHIGHO2_02_FULL_45_21]
MKKTARKEKGFTLIEMIVVVAMIGVLAAMITPQITNSIYKTRVTSTAGSLKSFKMALDMLINDIGVKPPAYGLVDPTNDQLALMRRTSCPGSLQSLWNGPYITNYPTSNVSPLFYYSDRFYYYYSWPWDDGGTWGNWCGTGYGILLHTGFINIQAKEDVERALLGRVDPAGNSWLYWCGFYDGRKTPTW